MTKRAAAIIEVWFAFGLVHVTYRALKHFTPVGRWEGAVGVNFTPGVVMILFTMGVLFVCGRDFETYGLSAKHWRGNMNIGLIWAILMIGLAGVGLEITHIHFDASHPHNDMTSRLVGAVFGLGVTILFVWMFQKQRGDTVDGASSALIWLRLFILLVIPLAVAAYYQRPVLKEFLGETWLVFGAGCGEEIFHRGFIQSRIDQAFGKPCHLLGLDFGLGLFMSSVLFGFLHALNSVDYFQGQYNFAWWYGVQSCFTGLFYGCLREKTGSVLAGAVTHGLTDVWAGVPSLVSAP